VINIRMVTKQDFQVWRDFRKALWPKHSIESLEEEMLEIFSKINENPVFLAFCNDEPAGFLEGAIHRDAPGCITSKIAYIEGWFTYPNYRRLGIGRTLVEAFINWSKSLNIKELASDTTNDYPISPKAHIALGFKEVKPFYYMKSI
jgi:aminoglycoside 6'-N-acetyltransferase I